MKIYFYSDIASVTRYGSGFDSQETRYGDEAAAFLQSNPCEEKDQFSSQLGE
jgi:hypothetical protein